VRADDLSKLNAAFFTMNGVIAVVFFIFLAADLLVKISALSCRIPACLAQPQLNHKILKHPCVSQLIRAGHLRTACGLIGSHSLQC